MGLGLHPRIRKTRGESCSTVGKRARLPAKPVYAEIHPAILFPILLPWVNTLTVRRLNLLVAMQQIAGAFIETIH